MEEEKFTVAEFKKYIQSQPSFGDVFYYCTAENIKKANIPEEKENTDEESEDPYSQFQIND